MDTPSTLRENKHAACAHARRVLCSVMVATNFVMQCIYISELSLQHTEDACQPKTFVAAHDDLKLLRKRSFSTVVIPRSFRSLNEVFLSPSMLSAPSLRSASS